MVRMSCAAGLLLVVLLMPALQGIDAGISPVAAGTRSSEILPLPYRVPAAQVRWELEMTVLNLVNQERVAAGLRPLMPHAGIRTAARAHGIELFAFGYLSHRSRDGRWPDQRLKALGIRVRLVGENLAYAQSVREAHSVLVGSASHRGNMLSPRFRLTGIAVIDGGRSGVIVVEDFSD